MRILRSPKVLTSLCLALLLSVPALAEDLWLHVKVEESGRHGERVEVNIPLSVVESVLPHIAIDELQHGKLHVDAEELEGIDLREILEALRDTPDTDFVTVRSEDESVRVAKENDYIVIHVEDRSGRDTEKVRVRMPLAVVEALVSGGPNELDLLAALRVLGEFQGEELVRVEADDGSTVRVWIDSSNAGG